jgi:hypothetical protein
MKQSPANKHFDDMTTQIQVASQQAQEAADCGAATLVALQKQRQQLQRVSGLIAEADENIDASSAILTTMRRRQCAVQ